MIARFLLMCIATAHCYKLGTPFQINSQVMQWTQLGASGNSNGFVVATTVIQFYNPDGTSRGSAQSMGSNEDTIAVASSDYTIAAQRHGYYLSAMFFDINGLPYGHLFQVAYISNPSTCTNPSVATNPTASLIAWGMNSPDSVAYFRLFSSENGNPIGNLQFNVTFKPMLSFGVKVSASSKVFMACFNAGNHITAQMLSLEGKWLGSQFPVNDGADAESFEVASGSKASLVVWSVTGGPLAGQIWGQFIDLNGVRIGGNFRIALNEAMYPSVTSTTTGFQVVWSRFRWAFSQSFGERGGAIGTEFMASHFTMKSPTNYPPAVASSSSSPSSNSSILFVTSEPSGRIATGVPLS
eukprot:TRINITY_DN81_c1_g1_i1.p1 TRINITY_DN81_c1_g1~~TRINITY_DN81_c1_g1_i1.p1  ORF type:complete len:366 (+),score=44.09 TRINITY_DN81_c1_g1_i1:40-1098(+)